jgi:hypothetical protein
MITVVTSSLFLFSGLTCYYYQKFILSYLLFPLFITSTIHHIHNTETNYRYGTIIKNIDITLAHSVGLICLYECIINYLFLSILCLTYVICIYYNKLKDKPFRQTKYLHASIHVIGNLGIISIVI